MKPPKEELEPYVHDRKAATKKYDVSEKTIIRWLKSYNIYEHGHYGRGKIGKEKAVEIRTKHQEGASIKSLAKEYDVSFASISRVVHRITYKDAGPDFANVSVVYNPH
jgi:transposase